MNAKLWLALVGIVTVVLGLIGLMYPLRVMEIASFAPRIPTEPAAALSETRAIYGGLFVVIGAFTLWAATAPREHRSVLNLIGCIWLGVFAGRMIGISIDGNPGLFGWLGGVLEVVGGSLVLAAPHMSDPVDVPAEPPVQTAI